MTTPPPSRDRGFTLVELLVVIIIVGILAAIAIPVFLNQRKKAVDAAIKTDMRNVVTEINAVMNEKDDGNVWRVTVRGGMNPQGQAAPGRVFLTGSVDMELDARIDKDSFFYGVYYARGWPNTPDDQKGLCMTGLNRSGTQEWDGSFWTAGSYSRAIDYDSEGGWSRGRSARCQNVSY